MNISHDLHITIPSRSLEAKRIRKNLLIILSVLFTFDLIYLIFIVHVYIDHSLFRNYFKTNYELLWTLISVLYDAFGLFVTYRYYRTGLYAFACIGTVFLVIICATTGFIFLAPLYSSKQVNVEHGDVIGPLIFLIIFLTSAIFLLIIVAFSFKLANLISNNRSTITQSI